MADSVPLEKTTNVLLVDDDPDDLFALAVVLEPLGLNIVKAESGSEALRHLLKQDFAVIVMDVLMPGMNGFAALRMLRRDPATREIPVVMISGNEQATEQFYAQRIGADDFMKKPFSRFEVFARIERLLDADRVPKRPAPTPAI